MKKYDAGDLLDVSALGLESTEWLRLAISDINRDVQKIAHQLIERDAGNAFVFEPITTKIAMFEYLADSLVSNHEKNLKAYEEDEGQA